MKLILAIEPDDAHAGVLHETVPDRLGADLIVATSAAAAILEINKRVPDVLLVGRSISAADRDVIAAHAKAAGASSSLVVVAIPTLRVAKEEPPRSRFALRKSAKVEGWDPVLFVEQISRSMTEAAVEQPAVVDDGVLPDVLFTHGAAPDLDAYPEVVLDVVPDVVPSAVPAVMPDALHSAMEQFQSRAEAQIAEALDHLRIEAAALREQRLEALERDAAEVRDAAIGEARTVAAATIRESLSADFAALRQEAEDAWSTGLASVRAEAGAQLAAELSHVRTEAGRTLERSAGEAFDAAVEQARAAAVARVDVEIERVREEAAAEAQAKEAWSAELVKMRADAEARLGSQFQQLREETVQAQLAQEQGRREIAGLGERAIREARTVSEEAASRQLQEAITRVRTENRATLDAEVARFRDEIGQTKAALEKASHQAAAAGEAALAKARELVETQARETWSIEFAHLRAGADEQIQRDIISIGERAADDARTAAEVSAARQLQDEIAKVHADGWTLFDAELKRLRQEVEHARQVREQMLAEVEALQSSVERKARAVAEDAAACALQAELTRVRADAEARIEADLALLRQRAGEVLVDQQQHKLEMERIREQALQEARLFADSVAIELAQVRQKGRVQKPAAAGPSSAPSSAVDWSAWYRRFALATAVILIAAVGSLSVPLAMENAASDWMDKVRFLGAFVPAGQTQATPLLSAPVESRLSERSAPRQPETRPAGTPTSGFVTVSAGIPLELFVGTERIGEVADGKLPLDAGRYTIDVVSERFNFRGAFPIDIEAGQSATLTVPLPTAPVHVEAAPGAEIWIDDQLAGAAPFDSELPIGIHAVVVKHPELGERRQSIDVKFGETTSVTVAFDAETQP